MLIFYAIDSCVDTICFVYMLLKRVKAVKA